MLIFSVVVGDRAGYVAGATAFLIFASVWWALPAWMRAHAATV
jgi:hypothetical protein